MNRTTGKIFLSLKKLCAVFLSLIIILPLRISEAKTVRGIVLDKAREKPIAGSMVMLIEKKAIYAATLTDSTGVFAFDNVPFDRFNLKVRRMGFAEALVGPLLISKLDTLSMIVKLEEVEITLDEIVVQEKRVEEGLVKDGFYERKKTGMGKYLSYEAIKERHFAFASDILTTIPGLIIVRGKLGANKIYASRALYSGMGRPTEITVYLDGIPLENSSDLEMINPSDIAAVEFYNISTAPAQYYGAGGSLLVWTKK